MEVPIDGIFFTQAFSNELGTFVRQLDKLNRLNEKTNPFHGFPQVNNLTVKLHPLQSLRTFRLLSSIFFRRLRKRQFQTKMLHYSSYRCS